MTKFFNISKLKSPDPAPEDKSAILRQRFIELHDMKLKNVQALLGKVPEPDEIFFLWTVNSFNAFTFIPWLINHHKHVHELVISTYSINSKIINALTGFIDNALVDSVYILISDSAKFRIPKVVDHLNQIADSHTAFSVRYAWNHSKVTLIRAADHHYVIEGSGNFSENSRHEQYIIIDSKQVFDFRKKWITDEIHGRTT